MPCSFLRASYGGRTVRENEGWLALGKAGISNGLTGVILGLQHATVLVSEKPVFTDVSSFRNRNQLGINAPASICFWKAARARRHLSLVRKDPLMPQMNECAPICLVFDNEVPQTIRPRISYAFRVYAAIYGHPVVENDSEPMPGTLRIIYGRRSPGMNGSREVRIPWLYRVPPKEREIPSLAHYRFSEEDFYLSHGVDTQSGNPDWLGEIFEWLSSSYEMPITRRDGIGRIPYSEMVFSRNGISPRKPHALLLMAWMENHLRHGNSLEFLPRAPSPLTSSQHFVVCSHDIDFYYSDWGSAFVRLIKNLGISYHPYRSWSYFRSNVKMISDIARGKRVGDYLPQLIEAGKERDFSSTLFVVADRTHRRDPVYGLKQITPRLFEASEAGFRVGLHGSYQSVVTSIELAGEAAMLENATGRKTQGSRQHWLRFDKHEKLFSSVERAQFQFDSSLGFAETVGFRNAACFAFPPYDFANERPHDFLEIPLVLMDGALEAAARMLRKEPQEIADSVLGESRKWGWGGIAALWHNPIEPLQVPAEINRVFWKCVSESRGAEERWLSAEEFLELSLSRYQSAGLLKGVRLGP